MSELGANLNTRANRLRLLMLGPLLGMLAVVACGSGSASAPTTSASPTRDPTPTEHVGTFTPTPYLHPVYLTFDDLGARFSTIMVYNGPGDSASDHEVTGGYPSGVTMPAKCKTTGRRVTSVPPEPPRTSTDWIELNTAQNEYATAVYAKNPEQLLAKLSICPVTAESTSSAGLGVEQQVYELVAERREYPEQTTAMPQNIAA